MFIVDSSQLTNKTAEDATSLSTPMEHTLLESLDVNAVTGPQRTSGYSSPGKY